MPHHVPLIATIAIALALAFAAGLLATRLRLPPLIGYLVVGVAIGPNTPGFVADVSLASQLAEIGVILLMFGVGMHFSVRDLMAVRAIALPGAIVQIVVAVAMGATAAHVWGWSFSAGIVFGLALSVASTVVMLRALEQRGMVTPHHLQRPACRPIQRADRAGARAGDRRSAVEARAAAECIEVRIMCRNIKTLFNFEPPVTDEEIRAASLQFVRKLTGFNKPSRANAVAFHAAIEQVAAVSTHLLNSLEAHAPPRNREQEAARARARAAQRFGA